MTDDRYIGKVDASKSDAFVFMSCLRSQIHVAWQAGGGPSDHTFNVDDRQRDVGHAQYTMSEPIHLTAEQEKLGRKIGRQQRWARIAWDKLPLIRYVVRALSPSHSFSARPLLLFANCSLTLLLTGALWLALLPVPTLWKPTFIDEHALMPSAARNLWSWDDVAAADGYLAPIEALAAANATWFGERAVFFEEAFARAGLETGRTPSSVFARVTPPRSEGTEAILVSANWLSRDGGANVRGTSLLLALGAFFRGESGR